MGLSKKGLAALAVLVVVGIAAYYLVSPFFVAPAPPPPLPPPAPPVPGVQEFSLSMNYLVGKFSPSTITVVKDIPVRINATSEAREHVNRIFIEPFVDASELILPGQITVIEFTPDRAGEFEVLNLGHGYRGKLVVAESHGAARERVTEMGLQEITLIYSLQDSRIFPEVVSVYEGIPVKVHNLSLQAELKVSIEPFVIARDVNVRPTLVLTHAHDMEFDAHSYVIAIESNIFEFMPDKAGTFKILDELHGLEGSLIVK